VCSHAGIFKDSATVSPKVIEVVAVLPAPVAQDRKGASAMAHDYIEVKGQMAVSSVALTRNEWIKAQRFGADYWLYIVVNYKSEPQLYVLQDPAAVLQPEEELEVVRYIVRAGAWQKYAHQVRAC